MAEVITNNTTDSLFGYYNEKTTYLIVLPICISTVSFDIFTLYFLLRCRKLRKVFNYPVISFMLAALIQDSLATPLYLYRYLHAKFISSHYWVCSTYRFAYFLSGHTMKISLLIISLDRLCSIKYSFRYKKWMTRKNILVVLLGCWIFIVIIDIIPFYMKKNTTEHCSYVPTHYWGITVITMFNTIPFVVITFNYIYIWIIAFQKESHERKLRNSISGGEKGGGNERRIKSVDDYRGRRGDEVEQPMMTHPPIVKSSSRTSTLTFALELKATRTSLAFTGMYLVCWGPMAVFYFLDNLTNNHYTTSQDRQLILTRFVIKMISFSSCPLAPLVYIWRSKLFQEEVQKKLCATKLRERKRKALINVEN